MTTALRGARLPTLAEIRAEKARRRRMARYRRDPVAFAHDCLTWPAGARLAPYQAEILGELPGRRRVAVRSGHTVGKTCTAAVAVLWFALTRDGEDWKVPTTASAWRQLSRYLWPEIHQWGRRLRWDRLGRPPFDERTELLALNLRLGTGEAFAVASDTPALIEGAHAQHLLYVFDEAKAIPDQTWDAAEGSLLGAPGAEILALAISTPGPPVGRFWAIHSRKPGYEDWWTRHVTFEEAVRAGRLDRTLAAQRRRQWGEGSAVYRTRVLGEFAEDAQQVVIPLAWVEAANERWRAWEEAGRPGADRLTSLGLDLAFGGEDRTVEARRAGQVITQLRILPSGEGTMGTVGRVSGVLEAMGGVAVVDVVGGAGVVDRLRELGREVLAFNGGAKAEVRDASGELGFVNLRSAAWWHLRELLDPERGEHVALPPDDELTGDLTAPTWRVTSAGKIEIESKESLRPRLGRSTDHGDAVVQAFAPEIMREIREPLRLLFSEPKAEEQESEPTEVEREVKRMGMWWPGGR